MFVKTAFALIGKDADSHGASNTAIKQSVIVVGSLADVKQYYPNLQ